MNGHARTASSSLAPFFIGVPSPLRQLDDYVFGYAHPGSHLKDHIYERSRRLFAAGDAERDGLQTPEEVRARQKEIRASFLSSIGGLPSSTAPLNPRVTGSVKGRNFSVEKIIFESRPRHYVTANLYLPEGLTGPTAAVLFLCGHLVAGKQQPEYQAVCQILVNAGLIVFAQDPIGQGERLSYFDPETQSAIVAPGTRDHDTAGAQCRFVGDSLARYFLHDAMRGIDYLHTRREVDPARIGVTGNSGGGTQASLVMLAEPRIAAAAPATFITTRDAYQRTGQPQDAEQIWPGFTRAGFDHEDILLAMAPKPVCVLAQRADFFPIEGTRRCVERVRRMWRMFDAASCIELVEDSSIHAFTPALARAAANFFAKHLLGHVNQRGTRPAAANFEPNPFPEKNLQCTMSGQVSVEFSDAEFAFDATTTRVSQAVIARRDASRKDASSRLGWLREQVFRDRDKCRLNLRVIERERRIGEFLIDVAFWWSQPNLANLGIMIRPSDLLTGNGVTLAVWDDGTAAISKHVDWIRRECALGRSVFVLNLSGVGPLEPDAIVHADMHGFYGTWHKFSDDLDWIGDSLVALRTYEVLRALEVVQEWSDLAGNDLRIYGYGQMGVHARLAAALDRRIADWDWEGGFTFSDFVRTRFYESNHVKPLTLPGALRHFDLDEI